MNHLTYKGYIGSIEYSKEDGLLFGKVQGIKSLISYEGESGEDLEADFQEAIDVYLEDCEEKGIEAEVAYKGSFNVRVSSELHTELALRAKERKKSLNSFVKAILEKNIGYDDKQVSVVVKKRAIVSPIESGKKGKLKSKRIKAGTKTTARAKVRAVKAGTRAKASGRVKKKSVKK